MIQSSSNRPSIVDNHHPDLKLNAFNVQLLHSSLQATNLPHHGVQLVLCATNVAERWAMMCQGAFGGEEAPTWTQKTSKDYRFGTIKAMEQTLSYPNYPFGVRDWLVLMSLPKVLGDKCEVCNQGLVSGNDAFGILALLGDG